MLEEFEFKGKTVEDAINTGLAKLGCNKEDALIRIVNDGATGLFGLMGAKPAVVLISVEKSKCSIKAVQGSQVEQNEVPFQNQKEVRKKLEAFLSSLLNKMDIKFSKFETSFKDDLLNVNIFSNDASIIGENGQTLESIEYLTQIVVNKNLNSRLKVKLDCKNLQRKAKR
jgi:spoIIIJ-associated protein